MEQITGHYTIKQIFQDWWDIFRSAHPELPEYVCENVRKMLSCRDPKLLGYVKARCADHPEQITVIPRSCKSRFCNSCGKIAVDKWLVAACDAFPNVPYAHITWTVPSEFRPLLREHPEHRKLLFSLSAQIVLEWYGERGYIPAITSVLHTFGRDLKFHPHIHMLVSSGGLDSETKSSWTHNPYVPEGMLKARWKTKLLYAFYGKKLISHRVKRILYQAKWFLYVSTQLMLPIITTNYIGRYTKRPPLSEARIECYDGISVTFAFSDWYLDKQISHKTVSALEFIELLIQHIPPKHARLINHCGLLHNRVRNMYKHIVKGQFGSIPAIRPVHDWRTRQREYHKRDPLLCPICQKEMIIVEIAYWSRKRGSLTVILQ